MADKTFFLQLLFTSGLPPPATNLSVGGGHQDLAPEKLEAMQRRIFIIILFTRTGSTKIQKREDLLCSVLFICVSRCLELDSTNITKRTRYI